MFGKLFGKRGGQPNPEAVAALRLLDRAILSIHPEKYVVSEDAALDIQPLLVNVNTMLGRPEVERFYPVEYEALVQRIGFYVSRNVMGQLLTVSAPLQVVGALMRGALHEYNIRHHGVQYDAVNLGKEVKSSTLTLIDFLNRCAKTKPEPMPPRNQQ